MKKNGFTLIELLAVIVILAIIALIAVPIILNIINTAREESNKRSIELYASSVRNSIAAYQLTNPKPPKTFSDLTVEYKGDVECSVKELYSDGSFYLEGCRVNKSENEYSYGTKQGTTNPGGSTDDENDTEEPGENTDDENNNIPTPVSFAEDSWETIAENVKAGNLSTYNVGDTKEIELTGFTNEEPGSNGLYTIRIANTSTPEVCNTEGFSQTACGFVIEFEDIITLHNMNSTDTNVGGYSASSMYTYIQNDIYNALPEELKSVIILTTVVSSHGLTSGETNFVSEDKVYLLSPKEVWLKRGTSNIMEYDTTEAETRQLDYYDRQLVTTDSYYGASKKLNGSVSLWWLRSAVSGNTCSFYHVLGNGNWGINYVANNTGGVAVAFRIG